MYGAAAEKWRVRRLTNTSFPVIQYENLLVGISVLPTRVSSADGLLRGDLLEQFKMTLDRDTC
jgi:hypothetical protein